MLIPKKLKRRKVHRGRGGLAGKAQKGTNLSFGSFGLKAVSPGELTSRQIEAARRSISRFLKRAGKLWIRVFPHKPITRKAAETPMGSGKGSVEFYVFPTKAGKVIFEVEGVSEADAREAMRRAGHKLPMKTRFVTREV